MKCDFYSPVRSLILSLTLSTKSYLNKTFFHNHMKIPKTVMRYCPYCGKHTEHKVKQSKKATPGSAHPLSHGSKVRQKARGVNRGFGNQGRYSRKPVGARKRGGRKTSKKTDLRYECTVCKKAHVQSKGIRTKKLEIK